LARMRDGRFKVAAHLADWWDEFRSYHRDKGLIVKLNDDLMSATRIAVMAHRNARVAELPSAFYGHAAHRNRPQRRPNINPWTGRAVDPMTGR